MLFEVRLEGVVDAFRQGELPSNAEIDTFLQNIIDSLPVDLNQLSPTGCKIVRDIRDILGTARLIMHEKNHDQLLQNVVWNMRDVKYGEDDLQPGFELSEKLALDGSKVWEDIDDGVKHLRTLLTLILSKSEVRRLLFDFLLVGPDLLSKDIVASIANASHTIKRGREFLAEKSFPRYRDQLVSRGKKILMECQQHEDYQDSMRWFLSWIEEYAKHGRAAIEQGKDHLRGVSEASNLSLCIRQLCIIVERFANGSSLDIITRAVADIVDDANQDEALREWFSGLDLYIRKVLLEPGYILESACNDQADRLREIGRQFCLEKYPNHFDILLRSIGTWFTAVGEDPLTKKFSDDWKNLTKDLLFNSEGSLKFKPDLWNDIRNVVLPALIKQFGFIPIPRVEYNDDIVEVVVENLNLKGSNFLPKIVQVEANSYVEFSSHSARTDNHSHRIKLTLKQLRVAIQEVKFYYRVKLGPVKMKDSGFADVLLGGEGFSATIELVSTPKDLSSVIRVQNVRVKVDTFKFSIRNSKHDFIYKMLQPLAAGLIKKLVRSAIQDALITGVVGINDRLVSIRDQMGHVD